MLQELRVRARVAARQRVPPVEHGGDVNGPLRTAREDARLPDQQRAMRGEAMTTSGCAAGGECAHYRRPLQAVGCSAAAHELASSRRPASLSGRGFR